MTWKRRRARYTKKPHPGRTAVYQFRDATDQAHLYVGITNNPERRFSQHAGLTGEPKKWWWDQADHQHVTITWYPKRSEALKVEDRLIKRLRPPGNKLGNPDWEATTTWRPHRKSDVVDTFHGPARPAILAALAWSLPLGSMIGAWNPPAILVIGGVMTGLVATRRAWRNLQA